MAESHVQAQPLQTSYTPAILRGTLLEEILRTRGFPPNGRLRALLEPIVKRPLDHFINICYEFDRRAAEKDFLAAARWMLPLFARGVEVMGVEHVPTEGPVLIVSNHPGAFDEVVIAATVPRADIRIFANKHPILAALPAVSTHAIYSAATDTNARMNALRNGIRNLREGRMLLLFPTGRTDPDPRRINGAAEALANWSHSIDLLVKKAPETQVVVSIVSGMTSPVMMRNPFTWLKRQQLEKQKLAQTVQLALQMLFPRLIDLVPRITFGPAMTLADLTQDGAQNVQQGVIEQAKRLLHLHTPAGPLVQPVFLRE